MSLSLSVALPLCVYVYMRTNRGQLITQMDRWKGNGMNTKRWSRKKTITKRTTTLTHTHTSNAHSNEMTLMWAAIINLPRMYLCSLWTESICGTQLERREVNRLDCCIGFACKTLAKVSIKIHWKWNRIYDCNPICKTSNKYLLHLMRRGN